MGFYLWEGQINVVTVARKLGFEDGIEYSFIIGFHLSIEEIAEYCEDQRIHIRRGPKDG